MTVADPVGDVFDVTAADFEADVLEASKQVPVVLDFWATWCGPCKALGPILEKLAGAYGGAFRLGKVNVDEERELAGAFQIRSIPTVILVKDGKPLDGFTGALPEGQVRGFLDRHVTAKEAAPAVEQAPAPTAPAAPRPVAELRTALAAKPDDAALRLELVRALLAEDDLDGAETELAALADDAAKDGPAAACRAHIELARALVDAPDLATLEARVARVPEDWAAQDQLALRHLLAGDSEAGLEALLHLLEHAGDWQDGQARKHLLLAFQLIDDVTVSGPYRRRMSSLLF